MGGGDWRATLKADLRPRNVEKIMEALKTNLQVSGPEGFQQLKILAEMFEEEIYTAATSQSDYLHKISSKTLPLGSMPPNSAGTGSNPTVPGASPSLQTQVHNQGLSLPTLLPTNQPQARQQLLSPNLQSKVTVHINGGDETEAKQTQDQPRVLPPWLSRVTYTGAQSSATLPSSSPSLSGMNNSTPVNVIGQNASTQNNTSNVAQNPAGSALMAQKVPSNMSRSPQNLQQLIPLHQQLMQRQQLLGHQQQPQLQQNVMQAAQLQAAKQSGVQTLSMSSLQPNQLSPVQQSMATALNSQQQLIQSQQLLQQSRQLQQQSQQLQQQKQQLQQQKQQQFFQQQLMQMQNQLLQQQSNPSGAHQSQLGSQSNISGVQQLLQQQQQQLLGTQSGNSSMGTNPSDGSQANVGADYQARLSSIFVRFQGELTQLMSEAGSSPASTSNRG